MNVTDNLTAYLLILGTGIAVLFFCIFAVKRLSVGKSLFLSIPLLFFFIFGFMEVLGNLLLFNIPLLTRIVSEDWASKYLYKLNFTATGAWRAAIAFNLSMACVALGVWFAAKAKKFKPDTEFPAYLSAPFNEGPGSVIIMFILLGISGIFVSLMYFIGSGGFPVLNSMIAFHKTGNSEAAGQILTKGRYALTYTGVGKLWGQSYFEQFRTAVLPFAAGFLLFYPLLHKKKKIHIFLGIAAALIAVFLLMASGQRHPLIRFFIAMMASYTYIRNFSPKKILLVYAVAVFAMAAVAVSSLVNLFIVIGIIALLSCLFKYTDKKIMLNLFIAAAIAVVGVSSIFISGKIRSMSPGRFKKMVQGSIIEHVFLGNAVDARQAFELFPEKLPFQRGKTWLISLASVSPRSKGGFSRKYHQMIYGETGIDTISRGAGSSPATIAGESYINFGFAGVIVISFMVGMTMQLLHIFFIRLYPKTVLDVITVNFTGIGLAYAWGFGNLLSFVPMGAAVFLACWLAGRFLAKRKFRKALEVN